MYIESIELKNFRNYQDLQLDFDKGTNIFYGDNAQGKTNILESVYICGTTKSHKGSKDKEIIRFGEEESHIRMMVKKDELSYKIDMHLRKNKAKGVAINGLPIKKARELFGIVNLVFFSPEDLNIIKNGPGERRRFMDLELCQLDQIYLTDLAGYNHIVNQRNRLLKDLYQNPSLRETLEIWDIQMLQYGKKIIEKRRDFVRDLNDVIQDIHRNLTGGEEHLEVIYEPSTESECFEEIYLVKEKIKDTPILLLDDVLSELDSNRQTYLLDSIHDIQTLITCTGLDDFVSHQFHINKVFKVVKGEVFNPVN